MASLTHKHILPVLDFGRYQSWWYLVTPYIRGGTLADRIARAPLSVQEVGTLLTQLISALEYAHARGLVHRDIKPSNVLFANPHQIYLADFGLAKWAGTDRSLTQEGSTCGTAAYLAPELLGGPATVASDIYALGVLLYECLTGQLPFAETNLKRLLQMNASVLPPAPSTLNPALSPAIDIVVLTALAKEPGQRFQTAYKLLEAYQQAGSQRKQTAFSLGTSLEDVSFRARQLLASVGVSLRHLPQRQVMLVGCLLFTLALTSLVWANWNVATQPAPANHPPMLQSQPSQTPTQPAPTQPTGEKKEGDNKGDGNRGRDNDES